jgi:hypothetical protein
MLQHPCLLLLLLTAKQTKTNNKEFLSDGVPGHPQKSRSLLPCLQGLLKLQIPNSYLYLTLSWHSLAVTCLALCLLGQKTQQVQNIWLLYAISLSLICHNVLCGSIDFSCSEHTQKWRVSYFPWGLIRVLNLRELQHIVWSPENCPGAIYIHWAPTDISSLDRTVLVVRTFPISTLISKK